MNDVATTNQSEPALSEPQQTVAGVGMVQGRGLMHGSEVELQIQPAPAGHGIVFERSDLDPPVRIPAVVDYAVDRDRRTVLCDGEVVVETVEHCLSAIRGCGIDNALLSVNGPEIPLGDGSADPFVQAIQDVLSLIHI